MEKLCSGELLYRKFIVPCDPKVLLDRDYGEKNWDLPILDGTHKLLNMDFLGKMNDLEWKNSIRFFNGKGFDRNYTIEFINKHVEKKVTAVEDDD